MADADIVNDGAASDAAVVDSAAPSADARTGDSSPTPTSSAADSAAKAPDAQGSADNGSLKASTDAQSNTPASKAPTQPDTVPRRDLENMKRILAQRQSELQRLQQQSQQWSGIDPATVSAFRKQQEEAKAAKLPMWNTKHPEYSQFGSLKARWQQANQTYARLLELPENQAPDRKAQIRSQVLADFTPEQQQMLRDHSQHIRQFNERWAEDPRGTIKDMILDEVRAELAQQQQQFQQRHDAEQSVGQWFGDQANSPVVESQREWMIQQLEAGVPWSLVRLNAENRFLRSQLGASNAKALSAEERARLAKGNASITRDPVTTTTEDDYDRATRVAKERGIQVGGNGWLELITSLGIK